MAHPEADSRKNFFKSPGFIFLMTLILAFGVRVAVSVLAYSTTVDTATPGLMAVNILKGEFPLFFYGQQYMGALEAYLAAVMFKLFGVSEITLSLSPILFSIGWIAGMYMLFKELFGHKAGIACVLVMTVPGWYVIWYSIASYGGYPGAFCFGTWAAWLCFRIAWHDHSPASEWAHILVLGFICGLALWTNYLAAPYIIMGAAPLAAFLIRKKFKRELIIKFLVGGCLFLIAFLPVILSYIETGSGDVANWEFSSKKLSRSFQNTIHNSLPALVFFELGPSSGLAAAVTASIYLGLGLFVLKIVTTPEKKNRLRLLLPVFFLVIFLILYLPHKMSRITAPRYMIPFWTMLISMAFGATVSLKNRWLRGIAGCVLAFWLAFNTYAIVVETKKFIPKRKIKVARRKITVENARKTSAEMVIMIGAPIFGYRGQILGFYSEGEIPFVSVFKERHQPSAQLAESHPNPALAFRSKILEKVKTTLDQIQVEYKVMEGEWVSLVYDMKVRPTRTSSVPLQPESIALDGNVSGDGGLLTDRIRETSVEGDYGDDVGFTIDLGRVRKLDGLRLMTIGVFKLTLPKGYTVSVSTDGAEYRTISDVKDSLPVSYISGNGVYLKGYFGFFECRFSSVEARYLRMRMKAGQGRYNRWKISELFVLEHAGSEPADLESETVKIASFLKKQNIDFSVCDRWFSAKLIEMIPSGKNGPPAYPRFNPGHSETKMRRVVKPRKGLAIVPGIAYADECERLIKDVYGENAVLGRKDFSNYSVILTDQAARIEKMPYYLVWDGFTLLKTENPGALVLNIR